MTLKQRVKEVLKEPSERWLKSGDGEINLNALIKELTEQLTTTQQALDSAVEALKAIAKNDHGLFYKADYEALMHRGIKIAEAALAIIKE